MKATTPAVTPTIAIMNMVKKMSARSWLMDLPFAICPVSLSFRATRCHANRASGVPLRPTRRCSTAFDALTDRPWLIVDAPE